MDIQLFTKTTGCYQCTLTKRFLDINNLTDKVTVTAIDQPENAGVLEDLKAEGLTRAPVIMLSTPITHEGKSVDHWTGFQPDLLKALKAHVEGEARA